MDKSGTIRKMAHVIRGLVHMSEEWVTMTEAADRLKVKRNKISRLASRGVIQTRENPLDARVRLVDINELRALFGKYGSRLGEEKDDDDES
jgi:hypothetical protein